MPAAYELKIEGLEEQLANLARYEPTALRELTTAMQQSVIAIESAARPLTPVGVSGQLRQSIGSTVVAESAVSIVGRVGSSITGSPYPVVMELGRTPGARQPPSEALERWVHLKLGVPESDVARVARQVARNIGRRGIKGRGMLRQGYEKVREQITGYFQRAGERITEFMAKK